MSTLIMQKPAHTIPPRTMMEVFESLPEGTLIQLIENNLVMSPAPTTVHQRILGDIFLSFATFVKQHHLGEVFVSPVDVYLDRQNAFQPDIVFVSKERQQIVKEKGLYGAPDIAIELLSPTTGKYDQQEKKVVYERSGVKEYWIVDPKDKSVQGFQLVRKTFKALPPTKGIIHSVLLQTEFRF